MLAHSCDRFSVVTRFILPTVNNLKFSTINFSKMCDYLKRKMDVVLKLENIFLISECIAER